MNTMIPCKSTRNLCIYGAFALFYFWMAAQIPYTHDDWDWGLEVGLHQLVHATVNSRYAGNFLEVIMTRSELVRILIMGSGFFLIPYLLSSFASKLDRSCTENDRLILFIAGNCILLSMDRSMWTETYGWTAGYANFVISALFMMIWIAEIQKLYGLAGAAQKDKPLTILALFLLSTVSQLFLENLAIFHVILAVVLCVIHRIRNRSIPTRILLMTLGSMVGLAIMFSSSLYGTLFSNGTAINGYRVISILGERSLSETLYLLLRSLCLLAGKLYARNVVLCCSITTVMISLLMVNRDKLKDRHFRLAVRVNLLLLILLPCCLIINYYFYDNWAPNFLLHFPVTALFFLSVSADLILLFRRDRQTMLYLSTLWLCIPVIIAPLIVTTESGSRLFFNTNVYLLLFLLSLLCLLLRRIRPIRTRTVLRAVSIFAAVLLLWHGYVYANIGAVKRERLAIIRQSVAEGASQIVLPPYPFPDYLQHGEPSEDWRVECFKEFYGIPGNVDLIISEP